MRQIPTKKLVMITYFTFNVSSIFFPYWYPPIPQVYVTGLSSSDFLLMKQLVLRNSKHLSSFSLAKEISLTRPTFSPETCFKKSAQNVTFANLHNTVSFCP